jgi:YD repeat-containing protein
MKNRTRAHTAKLLLTAVLFWGTLFNWATAAPPLDTGLQWYGIGTPSDYLHDATTSQGHIARAFLLTRTSVGGIRLPFRAVFNSGEKRISPFLGKYWSLPLLESIAYPADRRSREVLMPDGLKLRFYEKKPGEYHASRIWSATLNKDVFIVKSRYGLTLTYKNGRLQQLKFPNGDSLDYFYKEGRFAEVKKNGGSFLKVSQEKDAFVFEQNVAGGSLVKTRLGLALVYDGKEWDRRLGSISGVKDVFHTFEYKNDLGVDSMIIKDMPPITAKIRKLVEKRYPDDFDEEIDAKMPQSVFNYSWDATTGYAKKIDDCIYTITAPAYAGGNAAIRKVNPIKKYEEYFYRDVRNGKETYLRSDGLLYEREWFTTGVANGKEKSLTTTSADGKTEVVSKSFYDEQGRLARSIDHGKETFWFYDEAGKNVARVTNGRVSYEAKKGYEKLYKSFLKQTTPKEKSK